MASAFLDLFGKESTTHLLYTSSISEVVFNFFASTSLSPFRALFFLFFFSWVLGPLLPAPIIEEKTLERGRGVVHSYFTHTEKRERDREREGTKKW